MAFMDLIRHISFRDIAGQKWLNADINVSYDLNKYTWVAIGFLFLYIVLLPIIAWSKLKIKWKDY